ncbi:MAG: FKBP-type peptidyl-prolyl cis-trans isomerase, partial [Thermoleophilia bacterium]
DHMADRIVTVNREDLPPDYTPEVGHQLQSQQGDGRSIMAVINEVTDTVVKLDMNHPLAGKDLIFDIELVEIS